jgi:hypothetical protein
MVQLFLSGRIRDKFTVFSWGELQLVSEMPVLGAVGPPRRLLCISWPISGGSHISRRIYFDAVIFILTRAHIHVASGTIMKNAHSHTANGSLGW